MLPRAKEMERAIALPQKKQINRDKFAYHGPCNFLINILYNDY
jgi:hypothetical protein